MITAARTHSLERHDAMLRYRHDHPPLMPPACVRHGSHYTLDEDGDRIKIDNDHGRTMDGRNYLYHPTKGWRNMAAVTPFKDEAKLNPLTQLFRHWARKKGFAI